MNHNFKKNLYCVVETFLLLISLCYFPFNCSNIKAKKEGQTFSSMIDPEEYYSSGRAYGDIGVFPNREYHGSGIKIGIIDDGVPQNINDYNADIYVAYFPLQLHR